MALIRSVTGHSYATVFPDAPPEPAHRDPEDDTIDLPTLLSERRWTDADLSRAQQFGFPRASGRRYSNQFRSAVSVYSRSAIQKWEREIAQLVASLHKGR